MKAMTKATFKDAKIIAAARSKRLQEAALKDVQDLAAEKAIAQSGPEVQVHPPVEDESQEPQGQRADRSIKAAGAAAKKARSRGESLPRQVSAHERPQSESQLPAGSATAAAESEGAPRLAQLHEVGKCRVPHPCGHPECGGKLIQPGAPWFWWSAGGKEVYRCELHRPTEAELALPGRKTAARAEGAKLTLTGIKLLLEQQRQALLADSGATGRQALGHAIEDLAVAAREKASWQQMTPREFQQIASLHLSNLILGAEK